MLVEALPLTLEARPTALEIVAQPFRATGLRGTIVTYARTIVTSAQGFRDRRQSHRHFVPKARLRAFNLRPLLPRSRSTAVAALGPPLERISPHRLSRSLADPGQL